MDHKKIYPPETLAINDSIIFEGDALQVLQRMPSNFVQTVISSPPYWGLRDYGIRGQIGLEAKLSQYLNRIVAVFNEVKRILKNNGTLWLNMGDGYTSGNRRYRTADKKNPLRAMIKRPDTPKNLKPKDLLGIPWRIAFALQEDGWYLRSDIIWNKPNAMPESVKDRPTRSHEYIFLFSKSERYYYNHEAIKEIGLNGKLRNKRSVWNINTQAFPGAHYATFPTSLIEPCVLSSTCIDDYVLDPFFGTGTVGAVSVQNNRKCIGIELNPNYINLAFKRLNSPKLHIFKIAS
jgi:site-specific DNA-methyltransferase (adenine-specific)